MKNLIAKMPQSKMREQRVKIREAQLEVFEKAGLMPEKKLT